MHWGLAAIAAALLTAGCASYSEKMTPAYVSPVRAALGNGGQLWAR